MMGGVLLGWWLARKQNRAEADGESSRPWGALTPEERRTQLRQIAERKNKARQQASRTADPSA